MEKYIAKDELVKKRLSNVIDNFRGCMVENEDAPRMVLKTTL